MTKEQAIDRTIELWTWLAETGSDDKSAWPGWKRNGGEYDGCEMNCFLCEYAWHNSDWDSVAKCTDCPYHQIFGSCDEIARNPYAKWRDVVRPATRKKYAKLFLAQVKSLRED